VEHEETFRFDMGNNVRESHPGRKHVVFFFDTWSGGVEKAGHGFLLEGG